MKIGTLLTAAIVSLSTVGGGLAVYVAVSRYQTIDRIDEAQSRLAIVRAVSDIPRYLNPERGFAHQHPLRARDRRSVAAHRARQAAQADRRRARQDERAAQGPARLAR